MIYIWVGFAGMLGAVARYIVGLYFWTNSTFPFATLTVNLLGSFLLAWLATAILPRLTRSPAVVTAITTGFLGSFTTFSAVSVETVALVQQGKLLASALYVGISMIGGFMLSHCGVQLAKGGRRT